MARRHTAKFWSFVLAGAALQYMRVVATADSDVTRDAQNKNRNSNDVPNSAKRQVWRSAAVDPSGHVSLSEQDIFAGNQYKNLGLGTCVLVNGTKVDVKDGDWNPGQKQECESKCNSKQECGGYSVNVYWNCLLYSASPDELQANPSNEWGRASCMVKVGRTATAAAPTTTVLQTTRAPTTTTAPPDPVAKETEPVQFVACDTDLRCFALFDRSRALPTACCDKDTCTYSDCTTGWSVQSSDKLCPNSVCSADNLFGKACKGNTAGCGGNLKGAWTSTPVCKETQEKSTTGVLCACISEATHQSGDPVTLCRPGQQCTKDGNCICPHGKLMQIRSTAGRVEQHCTLPGALSRPLCCNKNGGGDAIKPTGDFDEYGVTLDEALKLCEDMKLGLCHRNIVQATLESNTSLISLRPEGHWIDIEKCELNAFTPDVGSCICESVKGGGLCSKGQYCATERGCVAPCVKGRISLSPCACGDSSPLQTCQTGEVCQNARCQAAGYNYQKITGFCVDDEIAVTQQGNAMRQQLGDDGGNDATVLECIKKCNAHQACAGFTIGGGKAAYPYFLRCRLLTAQIDALQLLGPYQCMHTDTYIARAPTLKTSTSTLPAAPTQQTSPRETIAPAPATTPDVPTPVIPSVGTGDVAQAHQPVDVNKTHQETTLPSSHVQRNSRISAPVTVPNLESKPLGRESTIAQQDTVHIASIAQQKNSSEFLKAEDANAKKTSFLQLNVKLSGPQLETSQEAKDESHRPPGDSAKVQTDIAQITSLIQQNSAEPSISQDASHAQKFGSFGEPAKEKHSDVKQSSFLSSKPANLDAGPDAPSDDANKQDVAAHKPSEAQKGGMNQPVSFAQQNFAEHNIPLDTSHAQAVGSLGGQAKNKRDDVKKASFLNRKPANLGAGPDVSSHGADEQGTPAHQPTETHKDEMRLPPALVQQISAEPSISLDASPGQAPEKLEKFIDVQKDDAKTAAHLTFAKSHAPLNAIPDADEESRAHSVKAKTDALVPMETR